MASSSDVAPDRCKITKGTANIYPANAPLFLIGVFNKVNVAYNMIVPQAQNFT